MMGLIEDKTRPLYRPERRDPFPTALLRPCCDHTVCRDHDRCSPQFIQRDPSDTPSVINQWFVAEKPFYNRRPLGKEGRWQHDERLPSKVAKNAAKHQQRLSQTHFIGNNTATNSKLGFLIHFSAKTPLQTCNLVRFLLKIDPWKPFAKLCQRLSNASIQVACNNCRAPLRPNRYRPPFRQNRYFGQTRHL